MVTLRQITVALVSAALLLAEVPVVSAAATMSMTLAPHCMEQDRAKCPSFETADAATVKTGRLAVGDLLDLDVVVTGSDFANVRTVRAWLAYDPTLLEARSVELTSELTAPTPGEQMIDAPMKLVKIGGGNNKGLSGNNVAIARVTFRVIAATDDAVIRFHNYQSSGLGNTAVNGSELPPGQEQGGSLPPPPCMDAIIGCETVAQPLLMTEPASLAVSLKDPNAASSASSSSASSLSSSVSSAPASGTTSSSGTAGGASTFTILQVQGVQVTTRDKELFIGWRALKSAELAGYNVYYGTVSGRYMQRRSVPSTATSLIVRDLEQGTTYYVAIRAVNGQNQESVFSQEVSVTVGKPETATAPLNGSLVGLNGTGSDGKNFTGNRIGGDTGINDSIAILLLLSAAIGTFFAFRRQMTLSSAHAI